VNDVADVLHHPQLEDRWREHPTPVGPVRGLRPPVTTRAGSLPPGAVPALGEHTGKVLTSFGFTADEIAELTAR